MCDADSSAFQNRLKLTFFLIGSSVRILSPNHYHLSWKMGNSAQRNDFNDESTPLLRPDANDDGYNASDSTRRRATYKSNDNDNQNVNGNRNTDIEAGRNTRGTVSRKADDEETPVPWRQFSIVLFLQLAEPLTSQVIYPFLPEVCHTKVSSSLN